MKRREGLLGAGFFLLAARRQDATAPSAVLNLSGQKGSSDLVDPLVAKLVAETAGTDGCTRVRTGKPGLHKPKQLH